MRYQKIESKIWHDEKFIALSPMQQRLFFYILTCPHSNLTGIFVLKPGYVCEDLKCLPKDFEKDLTKLIQKGLIFYDQNTSVLLIKNFLKHNPITNPNQRKAVAKELSALPKSLLLRTFEGLYPDLCEGLPKGLIEVLLKPEEEEETEEGKETEEKCSSARSKAKKNNSYSDDFLAFWELYPKKRQKPEAWREWQALNRIGRLPPIDTLMQALRTQIVWPNWIEDNGKYIPFPERWLKKERWEDQEPNIRIGKTTAANLRNAAIVREQWEKES